MYSLRNQSAGRTERLSVHAPAKVNLTLEVLARRPDGFHELETLMLAVSVCDTLSIEPTNDSSLTVCCHWAMGLQAEAQSPARAAHQIWQELPATPDNLVWKALVRLREAAGTAQGALVHLTKRVPAQAGLGGASADAAAALLAANRVWNLNWPLARLQEVATALGSDVAFFLTGGAAICRGRGEQIEVIRAPRCSLVIVRPPVGLSTPAVYKLCRPQPTQHAATRAHAAFTRGDLSAAARCLQNGLQPPAEELSPWIGRLRDTFARNGCLTHQMSGSGSSYFGLFWHPGQARRVARRLRALNIGAVFVAESAGGFFGCPQSVAAVTEQLPQAGMTCPEVIH